MDSCNTIEEAHPTKGLKEGLKAARLHSSPPPPPLCLIHSSSHFPSTSCPCPLLSSLLFHLFYYNLKSSPFYIMWRTLAKYAPTKKLKNTSSARNLFKESTFIEKFRSPDTKTCLNSTFSLLGSRQTGVLPQNDKLGNPSYGDLTNTFRLTPCFFKGYATAAASEVISLTDESYISGPDDFQGSMDEIDKHFLKMESQFMPQQKKMMAGMGVGKHTILKRRQVKMETEAWEQTAREYQEMLEDMCEQKLAPNLPYVKSLFLGWFEPLRDAILAEQELCKVNLRIPHGAYFNDLPADMMAVITMHKLMGLLMTGNGRAASIRVVQAASVVGEAIENEVIDFEI
ncbi:DNA-DIRECTED RNA polymerase [Salix koriyanagi]|uniref:DNA-DIRECTED RNA polymerase n=1 Tax=Salix koriyanagi TaxID=2511006 RepID=A0A9Q1AHZ0_9ROSI|nr:DNA-DIRECTED RNA polymerase [Salix koriyanagi]